MSGRARHDSRTEREPAILISADAPAAVRRRLGPDVAICARKLPLDRHEALESVAGISVGPDGRTAFVFLAAGEGQYMTNHAVRWDLERGASPEPSAAASIPLTVSRAAFSRDGRWIALPRLVRVEEDPTWAGAAIAQGVELWRGDGSSGVGPPIARAERCWPIAFHPNSRELAVASSRAGSASSIAITLWDVEERRPTRKLASHRRHDVFDLAFAPSGDVLAVAAPHSGVELWDPRNGELLHTCAIAGMFHRVAFSPDGERIAVGTASGAVLVIDVRTGARTAELRVGPREVLDVVFDPLDGATVAATCGGRVHLFDVDRGKQIARIDLAALLAEHADAERIGSLSHDRLPEEDLDEDELAELAACADELLGSPHDVVSVSWRESGLLVATGGGHVWHWPA